MTSRNFAPWLGSSSRLRTVPTLADVLMVVGERWTLLIVREIALGLRRFDDLASVTGAPRAVLSDRLRRLRAAGVLTSRDYHVPGSRSRSEYVLTDAGADLLPVLAALCDWGERHAPDATGGAGVTSLPEIAYCHVGCGHRVSARLVCECGEQVEPRAVMASVNR